MLRVCFVCLGNICRSPTAEGVMRHLVKQAQLEHVIGVESAGTGGHHAGDPPDERAVAAAARRGIVLAGHARKFRIEDWARFDYVLAMDTSNFADLRGRARSAADLEKLKLLRDFDPASPPGSSVPDPYYGRAPAFDEVLDLCEAACRGLLTQLRRVP